MLVECLLSAFSKRWGVRDADRALYVFLNNPVIQTGPHHRLLFDDDFSSTLAFSLRGRELVSDEFNFMFNCSTVTLEEQAHRGPAWLRFGGMAHQVFKIPRRRLSKKSVGEYREKVSFAVDIQAWMQENILGAPDLLSLLGRQTTVAK